MGLPTEAQPRQNDAADWVDLHGRYNIFALRDVLETDLAVSDGVRALGMAYIDSLSGEFERANQNLSYAKRFALARRDTAFAREVTKVELSLLRAQGRFVELVSAHVDAGDNSLQARARFWAETPLSSYISEPYFELPNISPDDNRVVVPLMLGGTPGTMLFDTGAENTLLSRKYANLYGAEPSGVRFGSHALKRTV